MKDSAGLKICPFCKEQIRQEAVKCRFCGEWFEEAFPGPAEPKACTNSTAPETPHATSGGVGRVVVANEGLAWSSSAPTSAIHARQPELAGKPLRQNASRIDYWYGYLSMVFCGYLAYCAATHFLATALTPAPVGDVAKQTTYWLDLIAWPGASAFFAYLTYALARHRVRMAYIYAVVAVYGLSLLLRGGSEVALGIWGTISFILVMKFREQKRLDAEK